MIDCRLKRKRRQGTSEKCIWCKAHDTMIGMCLHWGKMCPERGEVFECSYGDKHRHTNQEMYEWGKRFTTNDADLKYYCEYHGVIVPSDTND